MSLYLREKYLNLIEKNKGADPKDHKKRSNEKKTRYFFLKLINKKSSPWYNNSITKNQKIKGDDINE